MSTLSTTGCAKAIGLNDELGIPRWHRSNARAVRLACASARDATITMLVIVAPRPSGVDVTERHGDASRVWGVEGLIFDSALPET